MVGEINTNVGTVIKDAISEVEKEDSMTKEKLPSFINQLKRDIQKSIQNVGKTINDIIRNVMKGIGDNLSDIRDIVQNASEGLTGVLVSKVQDVIVALADAVVSIIGSGFGALPVFKILLGTMLKISTKVVTTSTRIILNIITQLNRQLMRPVAEGLSFSNNTAQILTTALDLMLKGLDGVMSMIGI